MKARVLWLPLLVCACAWSAGDARSTTQTAQDFDRKAASLPVPLAIQFRMLAAETLQPRHPEIARHFVEVTLDQLRGGKDQTVGPAVIRALAQVAPNETLEVLPGAVPTSVPMLMAALAQTDHIDLALGLYRASLAAGKVGVRALAPLIAPLARSNPSAAEALFQELVSGFKMDNLEPSDAWFLLTAGSSATPAAPRAVAELYERVIAAVSQPGYGEKAKSSLTATFQVGSATVATDNSRDTLLLATAGRLRTLAPERMEKYKPMLAKWDLSSNVTLRGFSSRSTAAAPQPQRESSAEIATIQKNLSQFRGLPTDADRAKLALETAAKIRALPEGARKLGLAQSLCNLSTEGDLGKEALTAVTTTLAAAIHDASADAGPWVELAKLVRYERLAAPYSDPALETAEALLKLREVLVQERGFTLTALDGKTYSLPELHGKVVLLNFWATWCPPCRKEMPDMEKLHREFEKRGLVVLAVSDEERDTVTGFLQKQNYTFPVLLDPGRNVNTAFAIEGIPKSFLFDREGNLVAQAIDMRTERQFREMLKTAGLE
jgi:peroxiredoxin